MGDIDRLTESVSHLQDSLGTPSVAGPESDLIRLEVRQDGTIREIRLSAAARALTPEALVSEIVRVHTAAIEEAQQAISAAIAALEADPRLTELTDRKADALNQALPEVQPASKAPRHHPASTPTPALSPPQHAAPAAPSPYDRQVAPRPFAEAARFDNAPATRPTTVEQHQTRSRQPTPEEEEEMDRYYGRKSWLEH
ncbi:hypothetical protein [Nocardia salmonicida]|uniref:hypothetical protein n=1 Tax=Nocardia salmonicida TaxID=53431 RepID=UPI00378C0076